MKEKAAERRPFLLTLVAVCAILRHWLIWRFEMKCSKGGTPYDLRRCGEYWVVVSFYTPFFGKEVGKGSEAAMTALFNLLTGDL